MRTRARNSGINVPDFSAIFNFDDLRDFLARVGAPWVIKPRTLAGSEGIQKLYESERVWRFIRRTG